MLFRFGRARLCAAGHRQGYGRVQSISEFTHPQASRSAFCEFDIRIAPCEVHNPYADVALGREHLFVTVVVLFMKTSILLLAIFLAGCAARPSLEQLEDEALASGDWTAVEHREAMNRKRGLTEVAECPVHQTKVCVEDGSSDSCFCAAPGGRR